MNTAYVYQCCFDTMLFFCNINIFIILSDNLSQQCLAPCDVEMINALQHMIKAAIILCASLINPFMTLVTNTKIFKNMCKI